MEELKGKVQRIERYGVFVWLGPGAVGLMPNALTGTPPGTDLARRFHTARAVCHATGRCAVPLSWPMSATAVAIGAVRSSGIQPSDLCER